MKIAVASDHAAFALKEGVKKYLLKKGLEIIDFGTNSEDCMDYPDTVKLAARAVAKGECKYGVVLCGAGVGASIVANKIRGIRAALCMDEYTAEYARKHNDANIMVLAGRRRSLQEVSKYIDIWFSMPFEGGRHKIRIDKIAEIEKEEGMK